MDEIIQTQDDRHVMTSSSIEILSSCKQTLSLDCRESGAPEILCMASFSLNEIIWMISYSDGEFSREVEAEV